MPDQKLSEMMTKSLGNQDKYEQPGGDQDDQTISQQLESGYNQYIKPLVDASSQKIQNNLQQQQQTSEDDLNTLRDRIRMQLNPNLQGPRLDTGVSTPQEQQYTQNMMGTAAMGSLGGAGKAKGFWSGISDDALQAMKAGAEEGHGISKTADLANSYLKNYQTPEAIETAIPKGGGFVGKLTKAAEEMPTARQYSPEELQQGEGLLKEIINRPNIPASTKQEMASRWQNIVNAAKNKGITSEGTE